MTKNRVDRNSRLRESTAQLLKRVSQRWHVLLLVTAVLLAVFACYSSFGPSIVIAHDSVVVFRIPMPDQAKPEVALVAQFKSFNGGFIAGEPIDVLLRMTMSKSAYTVFDSLVGAAGATSIENSERIEDYRKDFENDSGFNGASSILLPSAALYVTHRNPEDGTAILSGRVVFTDAGNLTIGDPLKFFFDKYSIGLQGLDIAPRYVQHEINAGRRSEFASFSALAVAFLALYLEISANRRRKQNQ